MIIFEFIGMFAFAISGVLKGIEKKLDLFGVIVLAIMTASGGGLIRDLFLHKTFPTFFENPLYLILVFIIVIFTYIFIILNKSFKKFELLLVIFDAIGLGTFSILTAQNVLDLNYPIIGVFFLGLMPAIGGGIIRDIMVAEVPRVLKTEIYALASIVGILLLILLNGLIDRNILTFSCVLIIIAIRIITFKYKIHLPNFDKKRVIVNEDTETEIVEDSCYIK